MYKACKQAIAISLYCVASSNYLQTLHGFFLGVVGTIPCIKGEEGAYVPFGQQGNPKWLHNSPGRRVTKRQCKMPLTKAISQTDEPIFAQVADGHRIMRGAQAVLEKSGRLRKRRCVRGGSEPRVTPSRDDPAAKETRPPRGSITGSAHLNGHDESYREDAPTASPRPTGGNQHAAAGWHGRTSEPRWAAHGIPTPPLPTPTRPSFFPNTDAAASAARTRSGLLCGPKNARGIFFFFILSLRQMKACRLSDELYTCFATHSRFSAKTMDRTVPAETLAERTY